MFWGLSSSYPLFCLCLFACLLSCFLLCFLSFLLSFFVTCLLACFLAFLFSCFPAFLLARLFFLFLAFFLACFLTSCFQFVFVDPYLFFFQGVCQHNTTINRRFLLSWLMFPYTKELHKMFFQLKDKNTNQDFGLWGKYCFSLNPRHLAKKVVTKMFVMAVPTTGKAMSTSKPATCDKGK